MVLWYAIEIAVLLAVIFFLTGVFKFRKKEAPTIKESDRLAGLKAELAAKKNEKDDITQTIAVTKELKEVEKDIENSENDLKNILDKPL